MADTNKDNVLTLAPELITFVTNTRQSVTVTVNTAEDSRNYYLTIDDVDYVINSGVGATVASIAGDLKTEVDLAALGLVIIDNLDGTLTIKAENAGIRFDINADLDQYLTVVINVKAHLGDDLFRIVLQDVTEECPYKIFKTEQERAQRYLVAHLLTILNQIYTSSSGVSGVAGDIIREKVGDVEAWYTDHSTSIKITTADADLMTTKYGKVFLSIRARHAGRFI